MLACLVLQLGAYVADFALQSVRRIHIQRPPLLSDDAHARPADKHIAAALKVILVVKVEFDERRRCPVTCHEVQCLLLAVDTVRDYRDSHAVAIPLVRAFLSLAVSGRAGTLSLMINS